MKYEIDLAPFLVPNFVRAARTDTTKGVSADAVPDTGGTRDMAIPLKVLSEAALSALCDRFRADVFAKAGKEDPRSGNSAMDTALKVIAGGSL